jgi:phage gp29-like protein
MNPFPSIKRFFANIGYPAPAPRNPKMRTDGEPTINTERVTQGVRTRFNVIRGLTPATLSSYLEQFELGFFRSAALAWDKIERRDFTLKSVAPKRKKAVARHGWEIVTTANLPEDQKALAQKQVEVLNYFYNNLTATDANKPDQSGGLALLVRQMMDAQSKYYAVHEIVWQPSPKGLTAQFVFCPLWWFEGTTGKLRYLENEFNLYGKDMQPSEWLVTVGEGLMESCAVAWMYKNMSLQDWVACCEKFGTPFLDAATTAEPGSKEWEALVEYVQNFGPDGGGVRSQSATITPIEIKNTSSEMFSKMVENMDRALTILWRGGDLGTTSGTDRTGASLQEEETEVLETDDSVLIEETLATQVSRYVISWTFGPDAPVLAYLKFRQSAQKNVQQDLSVDKFLLEAGAPLDVESVLERYGRPMPAEDAELLRAPAPVLRSLGEGGPSSPREEMREKNSELSNAIDQIKGLPEFAKTRALDWRPVIDRLRGIEQLDPALQPAALAQFRNDLRNPRSKLVQDLLKNPRAAEFLEKAMVAAYFNGRAEVKAKQIA